MKSLLIILISSLIAVSVFAQNSSVTINLNGNRNKNIAIDGKTYPLSTTSGAAANKRSITINDLAHGQHTLSLVGTNANVARSNSTTFNLRTGYDLVVIISGNGGVQTKEVKARNRNTNTAQYNTPLSDASYQVVYQDIKKQWSNDSRMTAVHNMFAINTNYFTTSQAAQLIQLINGENNRLTLAKASYRGITDPVSFLQLSSLFNSQASKNELLAYVDSYNSSNANTRGNTSTSSSNNSAFKTPMPSARYNVLYQDIQNQWQAGAKMTALTSAFVNSNNFFTTAQVRKLIQLVDSENSRIALAKSSYRSITDPLNFPQLFDVFSYQTSRDDVAAYVTNYNNSRGSYSGETKTNNNVYKTAMSDADFTTNYNNVKKQWFPGAKMSALTSLFATTSNFFTTSQAKQLIQLVSDETNRLQLAKASYRAITDPAGFSQLYDVFTTQASKDQLENYVRDYRAN